MTGAWCTGCVSAAGGAPAWNTAPRAGTFRLACSGEVVLAAGTIGSAQLLMLSGVGPSGHTALIRASTSRWTCRVSGRTAGPPDHQHRLPGGASDPGGGQQPRGGVRPRSQPERTWRTRPSGAVHRLPRQQVVGTDGITDCFALAVAVMQPFSRGTLRLSGSTAGDPVIIDPNYFGDERDMLTMVTGLRLARRIGEAAALDDWRTEEYAPGPAVEDDEALRAFVRSSFRSYSHPVGTCAIGDAPTSVVDSQLRVHGVSGLRLADASVMPSIPSNPTAATVYAIAERAAEMIAAG